MIARVTLEIALGKEFDYFIPTDLAGQLEIGSRVKVPFGPRQVMGCVTALVEQSPHLKLRPISKVVGTRSLECLLRVTDIRPVQVAQQIHEQHERDQPPFRPANRPIKNHIMGRKSSRRFRHIACYWTTSVR